MLCGFSSVSFFLVPYNDWSFRVVYLVIMRDVVLCFDFQSPLLFVVGLFFSVFQNTFMRVLVLSVFQQ